ncbi:DUF6265 family protein [Pedobacter panaciterrae]|jgi:hypothetical protein|uniref:DUF6265 family protein n=1 Tax=Pedobacter panaciterrae TaxID=363849 RepID=A0ABU8NLT3_9SPHI|nr:DUF6265 family protein [Pedobacter panaciterrae]NQX52723.1 hypothetical protein [Pedobacter panaciterrae]
MRHTYAFLLLFIGFLPKTFGQTQPNGGSVADVAFIQGHWKATTPEGQSIEGVWLQPEDENILGFMRMMKAGKADLYEILAYEQTEQGLVSMVKHFKPGLLGLEEKDKHDRYNFVEASKDRAIFQKEGESLRILYEKRSSNQFVIARGNLQDGKWAFKDLFVFNRTKP